MEQGGFVDRVLFSLHISQLQIFIFAEMQFGIKENQTDLKKSEEKNKKNEKNIYFLTLTWRMLWAYLSWRLIRWSTVYCHLQMLNTCFFLSNPFCILFNRSTDDRSLHLQLVICKTQLMFVSLNRLVPTKWFRQKESLFIRTCSLNLFHFLSFNKLVTIKIKFMSSWAFK